METLKTSESLYSPGQVVRYRYRWWVVVRQDQHDNVPTVVLRPLDEFVDEEIELPSSLLQLLGSSHPYERIAPESFPHPTLQRPEDVQDLPAVVNFFRAARFLIRDGTSPLRCMGRLGFRPRKYQFVPLALALQQKFPVRLFIADAVGVGKTIEALLIARELVDRGWVRRVGVLAPPQLVDQWVKEMREKFHFLSTRAIRHGTLASLSRELPPDQSLFGAFRYFVASIDLVKFDKYRHQFLEHLPDMIIVDEVHRATVAESKESHLRYDLLQEIARRDKHLVFLSATPHSGKPQAFLNLMAMLAPELEGLTLEGYPNRQKISRYFIQRTREDLKDEDLPPMPTRKVQEISYSFSKEYREIFEETREIVRDWLEKGERPIHQWQALTLLHCLASSPAAGIQTLENRSGRTASPSSQEAEPSGEWLEEWDREVEGVDDVEPSAPFVQDRLLQIQAKLKTLKSKDDKKLEAVRKKVVEWLHEGYNPIIWCRYVSTARYVYEHLKKSLSRKFPDVNVGVDVVDGSMPDEERVRRVEELRKYDKRVLVATECLSEGVNLQEVFNAVIHYDLPWSPTRLEQRDGRVDRFGQISPEVRIGFVVGKDNPVDLAIYHVLLRKALQIYRDLGTRTAVPIPLEDQDLLQNVLDTLVSHIFRRPTTPRQSPRLFEAYLQELEREEAVQAFLEQWERVREEDARVRSVFAHRRKETRTLHALLDRLYALSEDMLGSPEEVRAFFQHVYERGKAEADYGNHIVETLVQRSQKRDLWLLRLKGGDDKGIWVTFTSPPRDPKAVYLGRTHPLTEEVAGRVFNRALHASSLLAARLGAVATDVVDTLTVLWLVRYRYLAEEGPYQKKLLEEVQMVPIQGLSSPERISPGHRMWRVLQDFWKDPGKAVVRSLSNEERKEYLAAVLDGMDRKSSSSVWEKHRALLEAWGEERASLHLENLQAFREALAREYRVKVESKGMDLLGVLVLVPAGAAGGQA